MIGAFMADSNGIDLTSVRNQIGLHAKLIIEHAGKESSDQRAHSPNLISLSFSSTSIKRRNPDKTARTLLRAYGLRALSLHCVSIRHFCENRQKRYLPVSSQAEIEEEEEEEEEEKKT